MEIAKTMKISIVTEIEYNPDLARLDNIVCELDYLFSIAAHRQDVAEIKKTEIAHRYERAMPESCRG